MNYSINLKRLMCVGFVLGLSIAAVGCGDDSDDNNAGAGATSGTGDTGGAGTGDTGGAGTGDTGGSGGSTGGSGGTGGSTGGTGGMVAPMPIMCGTVTCNPVPTATGMMLPPCCDEDNDGACGATVSMEGACVATGQEGAADTACPSEQNVLMMMTPGCCKPDGKCGLLSGTLMGCVERTKYPAQFLFSMMPLTDEVTCTPGGDEDAGM